MLSRIVSLALCVTTAFLASCFPHPASRVSLSSGQQISVYHSGLICVTPDGVRKTRGFLISYHTDGDPSDPQSLEGEIRDIWSQYQPDAEKVDATYAFIVAIKTQGNVVNGSVKSHRFDFERVNGKWEELPTSFHRQPCHFDS